MKAATDDFKTVTCAYKCGIYAGKWKCSDYSIVVRYKGMEISMSRVDPEASAKAAAKLLLAELVAKDRVSGSRAWDAMSHFG